MNDLVKYRKIFGSYIKDIREKENLSQEGAAHKIGISRQQWNRLENGKSGTEIETVLSIAEKFNLDKKEVLNKAGFDVPQVNASQKPTNVIEFFEALDNLGFDVQFDGGIKMLETLDEDDLQELLDTIKANAMIKAHRKSKAKV